MIDTSYLFINEKCPGHVEVKRVCILGRRDCSQAVVTTNNGELEICSNDSGVNEPRGPVYVNVKERDRMWLVRKFWCLCSNLSALRTLTNQLAAR